MESLCRAAIRERYRLLGYLYSLAFEGVATGEPGGTPQAAPLRVRLWAAQRFCRVENGRALPESHEDFAGLARTAGGRQITAVFRAERELALRFLA